MLLQDGTGDEALASSSGSYDGMTRFRWAFGFLVEYQATGSDSVA